MLYNYSNLVGSFCNLTSHSLHPNLYGISTRFLLFLPRSDLDRWLKFSNLNPNLVWWVQTVLELSILVVARSVSCQVTFTPQERLVSWVPGCEGGGKQELFSLDGVWYLRL